MSSNVLHIILVLCNGIILAFAQTNDERSFHMDCNNTNLPIEFTIGKSHEFYCLSNVKYNSCILKRNVSGKTNSCKFQFHRPLHFGEGTPPPKQLQRSYWHNDCSLDMTATRITVLEKFNENVCHLQVNNLSTSGKIQMFSYLVNIA